MDSGENMSASNDKRNENNANSPLTVSACDTTLPTDTINSSTISQRDMLTDLLIKGQVSCVVCFDRTSNNESIWSCPKCYQIFHMKCIIEWYRKSNNGSYWRCPACQSEINGNPVYICFCGNLLNPFSINADIPHSCGQICGRKKNHCHHKCTLLCHPGPCPACKIQVNRSCVCGKTKVNVQCGMSAPLNCQNICSKQLNCKNHICEKICHAGDCSPCNKDCFLGLDTYRSSSPIIISSGDDRSDDEDSFEDQEIDESNVVDSVVISRIRRRIGSFTFEIVNAQMTETDTEEEDGDEEETDAEGNDDVDDEEDTGSESEHINDVEEETNSDDTDDGDDEEELSDLECECESESEHNHHSIETDDYSDEEEIISDQESTSDQESLRDQESLSDQESPSDQDSISDQEVISEDSDRRSIYSLHGEPSLICYSSDSDYS